MKKTICYIEMPDTRLVTGTTTYRVECEGTEQEVREAFKADPAAFWETYSYDLLEIVGEFDYNVTVESENPLNATLSFTSK